MIAYKHMYDSNEVDMHTWQRFDSTIAYKHMYKSITMNMRTLGTYFLSAYQLFTLCS